jgi:hypothetical protein
MVPVTMPVMGILKVQNLLKKKRRPSELIRCEKEFKSFTRMPKKDVY